MVQKLAVCSPIPVFKGLRIFVSGKRQFVHFPNESWENHKFILVLFAGS